MATNNVTVYIAMNEDGDYECATDASDATERLVENSGGQMVRVVEINIAMTAPEMAVVSGAVPDDAGTVGKLEAA